MDAFAGEIDYRHQNYNPIIIPAGQRFSKFWELKIDIVDDNVVEERREYYHLNISAVSSPFVSIFNPKSFRVTIEDDDSKLSCYTYVFVYKNNK